MNSLRRWDASDCHVYARHSRRHRVARRLFVPTFHITATRHSALIFRPIKRHHLSVKQSFVGSFIRSVCDCMQSSVHCISVSAHGRFPCRYQKHLRVARQGSKNCHCSQWADDLCRVVVPNVCVRSRMRTVALPQSPLRVAITVVSFVV